MNKLFKILSVLILTLLMFPTLNIKAEETLNVKTIDASITSDNLEVSGTVDKGIYAVIIMVYKDDVLYSVKTTGVDSNNSYSNSFEIENNSDYEIKVANYDGGNYLTKTISNKESETPVIAPEETEEPTKKEDPVIIKEEIEEPIIIPDTSAK